ncbi:MAG: cache domain-containing protein, partial [Deltaproteobacteria bacterium]
MAHRSEHIRRRILLAFGVVSFLGMATAILCIFWMQTHRSQVELQQQLAGTQRLLDSLVREESKVLLSQLRLLSGNERLRHAWLAGDRKKLLNISKPLFADLTTQYRIDHFYFIKPDRTCFLRVHKPDRYGDLITRYSLKQARQTGTSAHGLELGPLGTFTLRQVLPWRIDGKIAGYLELGESIENIAPKFQEIIGVELLFVINKDHLDRARWEEGTRMRGKSPDWGYFPDVVVENETMAAIPAELERLIRLPYREQRNRPFAITGENNTCFQGGFLPLVDSRGKELGEIIVLHDVTGEFSSLFRLTGFLIAVLVLLSSGLFWFFFFFMGRVERELLAARDDLVKEIEERRQAQRKLTGYKEQLEEIVADRTQELQAVNATLREEVASRELAERRARKATEDWERTFNAIGDIITLQDENMGMVRVNRAAAEAFGVEPKDLVGRHCYEIFRGKDHPCEACPEPQALRQLKMHSAEIEHPNLGKTFLVTASPLVDQEGRFEGVVHTAK